MYEYHCLINDAEVHFHFLFGFWTSRLGMFQQLLDGFKRLHLEIATMTLNLFWVSDFNRCYLMGNRAWVFRMNLDNLSSFSPINFSLALQLLDWCQTEAYSPPGPIKPVVFSWPRKSLSTKGTGFSRMIKEGWVNIRSFHIQLKC